MRLKLYSGNEVDPKKAELLLGILKLDTDKIALIMKEMIATVHSEESRDAELKDLAHNLNIDEEKLSDYLPVFSEVVLRILVGKGTPEVQQDLIKHDYPEKQVKFLFSSITSLPQSEKEDVRYWTMEGEMHEDRDHIHAIDAKSDVKTLIENGDVLGVLPICKLVLTISLRDKGDEVFRLELGIQELSTLIAALESARGQLGKTTAELKKKLGQLVTAPANL